MYQKKTKKHTYVSYRVELGNLLDCMGQSKSEEELNRLFNLMDADGGGSVDFEVCVSHELYI